MLFCCYTVSVEQSETRVVCLQEIGQYMLHTVQFSSILARKHTRHIYSLHIFYKLFWDSLLQTFFGRL